LIQNGKIAALGAHVEAPADAQRIDLKGKRVYPGYIAANSTLGLTEVEAVRATNDQAESGIDQSQRARRSGGERRQRIDSGGAGQWRVDCADRATRRRDGLFTGQSRLKLDGWTWEQMI
jgi:imidazolonepropionase-like amidohydrolase